MRKQARLAAITFRCSTIRTFRCSTDKDAKAGSTVKERTFRCSTIRTFRCSTVKERERRGCVSRLDWPPSPLGARLIRPPSRGEERTFRCSTDKAAIERRGEGLLQPAN